MWKSDMLCDIAGMLTRIEKGLGVGIGTPDKKKQVSPEKMQTHLLSMHAAIERATVFHLDEKDDFYLDSIDSKALEKEAIYAPSLKLPYSDILIEFPDCSEAVLRTAALISNEEGGKVLIRGLMCLSSYPVWGSLPGEIRLHEKRREINFIEEMSRKDRLKTDLSLTRNALRAKAISDFLQCANIASPRIVPPEKLNRSREKKGKLPLYEYRVLEVIQDLSGKGKAEAEKTALPWGYQTPDERKLSKSSGEFKTYTEDAPLLGKHVGTYWL